VTSVQLINVGELRSTDISNSPVIFANTKTAFQEVLYDALRAKEEVENTYITTCYNGRQTVFSKQTTQTIYSVETVTRSLAPAPGLQTPELEDLLAKFLSLSTAAPALPSQARLQVTSTEVTQTITHSSTYITEVTETESTELAITFRGKPIVTTILDSSVKEITATEFSTETRVDTQLVTRTVANPVIQNTQLPQLSAALALQNPNLENQLLLMQLSNLLPQQQQLATPALPPPEPRTTTFEVTHTSSFVTTLTEESSDVIPIIFRGKQIETTIIHTETRAITATEFSTETVTRTQQPAPVTRQPPLDQGLDLLSLGGLLPELLNIPELGGLYPGLQPQEPQYDSLENIIGDTVLDPRLIAALREDPLFDATNSIKQQAQDNPQPPPTVDIPSQPDFSVTTIFKSGRNPGEFTRLISTIYFDERRKRDVILPSGRVDIQQSDSVQSLNSDIPFEGDTPATYDLLSGLSF